MRGAFYSDIEHRLEAFGIRDFDLAKTNGGHVKLTVRWAGVSRFVILPSTPSTWRAAREARTHIKRELGLSGKTSRVRSQRGGRTKNRVGTAARVPFMGSEPAAPRRDFREALAALLSKEAA